MNEYHKINTLFKRDMLGDKRLIVGDWAQVEFEYLQDNLWEYTEKVDGTNIRVTMKRGLGDNVQAFFAGRTDNAQIPPNLLQALKDQFNDAGMVSSVRHMMDTRNLLEVTFYGEGYGPKIQGGGKYRDLPGFVVFDIKIGGHWLNRDAVEDICDRLDLDIVPVIGYGTLNNAVSLVKAGLQSSWGEFEAEGIVARPVVPMYDKQGKRIIAKIKSIDFK